MAERPDFDAMAREYFELNRRQRPRKGYWGRFVADLKAERRELTTLLGRVWDEAADAENEACENIARGSLPRVAGNLIRARREARAKEKGR